MQNSSTKKIAYLGMMAALAVMMGYVEYLIPFNFTVPGVKLGLCNAVILPVLYWYGLPEAFAVSLVRIVISGAMFGNAFGIFYSLLGTTFSLIIMKILKDTGRFSLIGVSAAGGAFHNIGQIIAAAITTSSPAMLRYLPVLLIAGDITGIIIGIIDTAILRRLGHRASMPPNPSLP